MQQSFEPPNDIKANVQRHEGIYYAVNLVIQLIGLIRP